jgi:hypothetical protein
MLWKRHQTECIKENQNGICLAGQISEKTPFIVKPNRCVSDNTSTVTQNKASAPGLNLSLARYFLEACYFT